MSIPSPRVVDIITLSNISVFDLNSKACFILTIRSIWSILILIESSYHAGSLRLSEYPNIGKSFWHYLPSIQRHAIRAKKILLSRGFSNEHFVKFLAQYFSFKSFF